MFQRNGQLLYTRFASYFFPTVIMSMALSMSIVVDGIIVGNMLGTKALAAVNLVLPITLTFSLLSALFGLGGTILTALHLGRREQEAANEVFSVSLVVLALVSVALTLFLMAVTDPLAALLAGGDAELETLVRDFLRVLVWGTALLVFTPGCVFFIRVDGWPVLASAVLVTANVINLAGDIFFIRLLENIQGASVATIMGYAVGSLMLLVYVFSSGRSLRFRIVPAGFAARLREIVTTGFASALDHGLLFLKIACINALVLNLAGASGMAVFSVCLSCLSLASIFIEGAADTLMPIVGVLYGEEDYQGVRFIFRRSLLVVLGAALFLLLVFEIFPAALLNLFGVDAPADLALGVPAIRLYAVSFFGVSFSFIMLAYYQTIGRPGLATAISLVEGLVVVVPLAWLLARLWGLTGVWLAFILTEVITLAFVLAAVRWEGKRSKGAVDGLLLLPLGGQRGRVLDLTIRNTLEEAVALSEEVRQFCLAQGMDPSTANKVALAVEEMAVNVVRHGHDKPGRHFLDLGLRLTPEEIIISFRDDGRPFNPLAHVPEKRGEIVSGGLELLKSLALKFSYTYTLNFNSTLIAVPRSTDGTARG